MLFNQKFIKNIKKRKEKACHVIIIITNMG